MDFADFFFFGDIGYDPKEQCIFITGFLHLTSWTMSKMHISGAKLRHPNIPHPTLKSPLGPSNIVKLVIWEYLQICDNIIV